MRIIDGEPLPPPQARDNAWSGLQNYLPVMFIAVVFGGGLLTAIFGRLIGASLTGGITGVIFWFLAGSTFMALIVAIVVFVLVTAVFSGPRIAFAGVLSIAVSLVLQKAGHAREPVQVHPFAGAKDFARRLYAEQFCNFWRFLFTGQWFVAWKGSTR